MIWLFLWIATICALGIYTAKDRYSVAGDVIIVSVAFGGIAGGMFIFLIPHMLAAGVWGNDPVYRETVQLQEVNGHYVTRNADGYAFVYGDERTFTSVQVDSSPPEPEEGCAHAEAKVYEMRNENVFWSILPMYFAERYVICVPEGGIKE